MNWYVKLSKWVDSTKSISLLLPGEYWTKNIVQKAAEGLFSEWVISKQKKTIDPLMQGELDLRPLR